MVLPIGTSRTRRRMSLVKGILGELGRGTEWSVYGLSLGGTPLLLPLVTPGSMKDFAFWTTCIGPNAPDEGVGEEDCVICSPTYMTYYVSG